MFRKILVANDGSEGVARALLAAIKLAKALGADLHMTSVEELPLFAASVDEVIEERSAHRRLYGPLRAL
jgi:nucleotide-binding universal stress UspA family protein